MNNNNNLIDDILKAIDIMATKKINSAGYDKTIQGTIVSCQDRTIGKYKIKYQDGYWYAYSTSGDVYYSNGTSVYILIPNGDMRKEKTILGAVQKLGTNYLNILEQEQKYNFIGNNIIVDNNAIFSLSSYKESGDTIVLYNKNNSSSENLIQINQQQMIEYLKQSPSFIIGADIQTQLNIEQQYQGNYGILVGLNFLDNATKSEVTRYYIVDVDMMTGNPYRFINGVHQSGIFEIDNQNFLNIDSISLFAKDFPNEDNSKPKDIFISNLEIKGAVKLSQTELDSYTLLLNTPKGYIFNNQSLDTDIRRIEAEVRIKGRPINLKAQSLPFYWFIQNNTITAKSRKYNRYGGQGWECLNQYNILNTETVQYIPMSNILQIQKKDVLIERVKYKCVTVYDNTILSKEITIINRDAEYRIFVESDQGTIFKYDVGNPTLTCHCQQKNSQNEFEDIDINNYNFVWSCINNVGNFESLTDSLEYNIVENKIINLDIKNITRFTTYKCAVFTKRGSNFLGTASITLNNLLQSDGSYTLIINNGSQVFKYNTFGISPASKQNVAPLEIPTLSFTVFDDIGNPVSEDIIKYSNITWIVPIQNTLLKIDNSYQGDIDSTLSKKSYKNLMSLSYDIAELYDPNKIDNTIQLKVNYNGMTLIANTNLTFIKEGNSGTNGTDFVCKIVPNVIQGGNIPVCPTLYFTDSTHFELNWITDLQTNYWFKVELWHNGNEPIFSGYQSGRSTEDKIVTIIGWEVLKNRYNLRAYDDSNINISTQNGLTGRFSFNAGSGWSEAWDQAAYVTNWGPANIIKVTLQYDGLTYYATLPLTIVKKFNSDYKLNLKPNTGFRQVVYTSAGIQPSYNNRIPFELILQHKNNSYWENVTDDSQISYKWYYFGSIKERGSLSNEPPVIQQEETKDDGSSSNFWLMLDKKLEELKPYQKRIKPADQYDGECVNIGLGCRVYKESETLAWIHIPIHMLRNRFENSALNGWDGNSVDLGDENGGTILAPQVGAGYKNKENKFTGIIIGKSKDSEAKGSEQKQDISGKKFAETNEDVGLFGFNAGARSIFLDAKTGKAVFGEKNKAQIILDPSKNKAEIKSGNYNYNPNVTVDANAGAGMMIDLSTPQIKYGTGNFEVNQEGHLIAKGGGKIANWDISDYKLTSETTGMSSQHDPKGEGAETVNFKSPFENLVPSIVKSNWIKGGVISDWDNYWESIYWNGTDQPYINPDDFNQKEHQVVWPNSNQKILSIEDHHSDELTYLHKSYICTHIDTDLRDNQAGTIVYLLNKVETNNYDVQLIILSYSFEDYEDLYNIKIYKNPNMYFSERVSNFDKQGILINISKQTLKQGIVTSNGNKFSYLLQIIKKDGTDIDLSNEQVDNLINNIRIFSSAHLSLASNIKTKAFWTKDPVTGAESYLTHDGILVSNSAILGSGINRIYIGKKENTTGINSETSIFSYKKVSKDSNSSGFYLGTDGLAIGKTYEDENGNNISNFQVDINGKFYAREGYIGDKRRGWTFSADKMYNKAASFGQPGFFLSPTQGMSLVAAGEYIPEDRVDELIPQGSSWPEEQDEPLTNQKVLFSVDKNGEMVAKKAYIANWYMTNNQLRTKIENTNKYPGLGTANFNSGNITISAGGYTGTSLTNIAITNKGIRIGSSFYVSVQGSNAGKVYCTNAYLSGTIYGTAGKIGGWTISGNSLISDTISGTNQKIELDGNTGVITLGGSAGGVRCSISTSGEGRFHQLVTENIKIISSNKDKLMTSGNTLQLWNIPYQDYVGQGVLIFQKGGSGDGSAVRWTSLPISTSGGVDISARKYKEIKRQISLNQYKNFYDLKVYQGKFKDEVFEDKYKGNFLKGIYHPMFIAEDVAQLDKNAAIYNKNNEIENWNYRVIIPIQHLLIRDLNDRVSTLQEQIKELRQLINK